MLPFTREQFLGVFADYNTAVWPVQVVAYVFGLAVVAALLRPSPLGHRLVAGALAAMWIWTGVAYHGLFFARINPVALAFGALFVVQGILFVIAGVAMRRLVFGHSAGFASTLGWVLPPRPRSSRPPGSAAACTSCATPWRTPARRSGAWLAPPSGPSSFKTLPTRRERSGGPDSAMIGPGSRSQTTGFFVSRWRREVPLARLFWRDTVVVGTLINLAASFVALVLLTQDAPLAVVAGLHC